MRVAVDAVLAQRSRLVSAGSRARVGGSLLVHLLIVGACAVAPLLAAQSTPEVPEFVPVYVVPAQALGIREPTPAPRSRPAPPEPDTPAPVEPEEETAEPEPEPALPSPEARRRRPPVTPPTASREGAGELGRRRGSPTGRSTGTSPFGADSVSFADQNFTYGYYIDQMLAMIHSQWDRPALGGEVEAAVFFRIRRDGRITDLRIVESSGFNVFDLAGLRAVRQAAPLPRLPVSYPQGSLAVKLILR
ncbi:MAG: energy transducer TonB [Thermoanaerobaculia bacterium]